MIQELEEISRAEPDEAEVPDEAEGEEDVSEETPAPDDEIEGAEGEAEEEEPDPEAEAESESEEEEPDPEAEKGLAAIQRQEKRFKERMATERAALAKERTQAEELATEARQIVAKFQSMQERASYDPAGVLEELGLTEDAFEDAAKQVYQRSPNAKGGGKAATAETMRVRRMESQIAAQEKRYQELEQRYQQDTAQRQVDSFLSTITSAATDETPLASAIIGSNPTKAKRQIHELAVYLSDEFGEVPEPSDVLKAYEKQRRSELEEMGVDPDELLAKRGAPKAKQKIKPKVSKTIGSEVGQRTRPAEDRSLSAEELREETIRELEAMQ